MPWIEFVTVKEATAADSARPRPVGDARGDLRAAARRAVENVASARVMRVTTPIFASLRAVPPASLRFLEGIPGLEYDDDTYTFVTDDLRAAYDGLVKVVGLATIGYLRVLQEVVRNRDEGDLIQDEWGSALTQRWFDQESGRYERPEPADGGTTGLRRYHGYR